MLYLTCTFGRSIKSAYMEKITLAQEDTNKHCNFSICHRDNINTSLWYLKPHILDELLSHELSLVLLTVRVVFLLEYFMQVSSYMYIIINTKYTIV